METRGFLDGFVMRPFSRLARFSLLPAQSPEGQGKLFIDRRTRRGAYLACAFLFALLCVLFSVTSWHRAVEHHDTELKAMVSLAAQGIDSYFTGLEKSLAKLGDELQRTSLESERTTLLEDYARRYSEFAAVVVDTPEGKTIANSARRQSAQVIDVSREASFINARNRLMKSRRMVVSPPFLGPVVRTWVTPLRYGVRDAADHLLFLVGAGLPLNRTSDFWNAAPLPPGAAMGLLDDDWYLLARHPLPSGMSVAGFTKPVPDGLVAAHLRRNGFPASGIVRGQGFFSGAPTTIVFQRLEHFPLTLFVTTPAANLQATWWALTWPTYVLMLALFACGIAMIQWTGRQQATREREREHRMAEMTDLAQQLESRNAELQGTNAALEAANAELEAFTYTVSHDLRAPIRAIDGFAAVLTDELAGSDQSEVPKLLERIRGNTSRMNALLDDLLDLSRYSKLDIKSEPIDMQLMVASVIEELGAAPNAHEFEVGALPGCHGDSVLIRQVWSNLLGNAVKYSAKNPQPQVRVGFEDDKYYVADNGAGFDMTYVNKLFRVFSRLHREADFKGTGVGLAIVKRIVARHGGQIGAIGEVGKGAKFWFSLRA